MGEVISNFELFLTRYCAKHECSKEEAMTHKVVQDVKEYYDEEQKFKSKKI